LFFFFFKQRSPPRPCWLFGPPPLLLDRLRPSLFLPSSDSVLILRKKRKKERKKETPSVQFLRRLRTLVVLYASHIVSTTAKWRWAVSLVLFLCRWLQDSPYSRSVERSHVAAGVNCSASQPTEGTLLDLGRALWRPSRRRRRPHRAGSDKACAAVRRRTQRLDHYSSQ